MITAFIHQKYHLKRILFLRKRKRKIPVPGEIAKRNKPETSNPSEVNLVSDDIQPLISNEDDHERDPDVFRCLSCFSIFMPTGLNLEEIIVKTGVYFHDFIMFV